MLNECFAILVEWMDDEQVNHLPLIKEIAKIVNYHCRWKSMEKMKSCKILFDSFIIVNVPEKYGRKISDLQRKYRSWFLHSLADAQSP